MQHLVPGKLHRAEATLSKTSPGPPCKAAHSSNIEGDFSAGQTTAFFHTRARSKDVERNANTLHLLGIGPKTLGCKAVARPLLCGCIGRKIVRGCVSMSA